MAAKVCETVQISPMGTKNDRMLKEDVSTAPSLSLYMMKHHKKMLSLLNN